MNEIANIPSLAADITSVDKKVVPSEVAGKYNNQQVVLKPVTTSILAKMETVAEEATFVNRQGEKKQFRKGKLERMRQENIRKVSTAESSYMAQVPDFDPRQVNDSELRILSSKRPAPEEVRRIIGQNYKDLTHQMIALTILIERANDQPDIQAALIKAKQQLEKEHGPEIRAGLNVSADAAEFAGGDLDKLQFARDFYRSQVLGYEQIAETYKSLVKEYGAASFLPAVNYLLSAVGSDLHSEHPSLSDVQLKPIIDDVKQLQDLRSVYDFADATISFLQREHQVALKIKPLELMDFILPLSYDSAFSTSTLEEIATKLGLANNLQAEISFINSLADMTRNLPTVIFRTLNDRQTMIEVVESYGNFLYDREEAEF